MNNESTYWIALAHLPKWGYGKINSLIIRFFHNEKISIEEFFNLPESIWSSIYQLDAQDIADLQNAKTELPNNAFLAENLLSQGFELIPLTSPEYSKTLKQNLKTAHSPALLYVKGNKQLLHENTIAIVGSRAAEGISLEFTDNIAKIASKQFKVVVSGFAKGVDKQALDAALKYTGQSIIVLPQGITTFNSGFKTYYKQIVDGDVLVLSTFHPKAVWSTGLAMARNPVIYGLADEIFVAESGDKGGTWSGVIDGLRKGRRIFVRQPEPNENNANNLLIQNGAIPVNLHGAEITNMAYSNQTETLLSANGQLLLNDKINDVIITVLNGSPLSAKDILERSKLDWPESKLKAYLDNMEEIQIIKRGQIKQYTLKESLAKQPTLFG
ncbi:MAG: DNA-processing protein DprA [Ferruginibacter sp.]